MYNDDTEDTRTYEAVVNHEEQYSIWLAGRPIPAGWTSVGKSGSKTEVLKYIEEVWTDMRPLSLRKPAGWADREVAVATGDDSGSATTGHSGRSTESDNGVEPSADASR